MHRTPIDWALRRRAMVGLQLRQRGIRDARVLRAMLEVPRHEFVQSESLEDAYGDHPLPIGEGQTISQPYMVAAMTEALAPASGDVMLEIGTGSGYQAAVLAKLVTHVYTIENSAPLAASARERLARLGYANVTCLVGDGSEGYSVAAAYDGIVVTAAAPSVPAALVGQLRESGRLVIPVGNLQSQELLLVTRRGPRLAQRTINYCRFVPLTGKYGWGAGSVQ